jgi:hypothetical protein
MTDRAKSYNLIVGMLALVGVIILTTGCFLPIRNTVQLSPRFQGHVLDAATEYPLSGVQVTLTNFKDKDGAAPLETATDADGSFSIVAQEKKNWTMIPPPEPSAHGVVVFTLAGYEPVSIERGWFGNYRPDQEAPLAIRMNKK